MIEFTRLDQQVTQLVQREQETDLKKAVYISTQTNAHSLAAGYSKLILLVIYLAYEEIIPDKLDIYRENVRAENGAIMGFLNFSKIEFLHLIWLFHCKESGNVKKEKRGTQIVRFSNNQEPYEINNLPLRSILFQLYNIHRNKILRKTKNNNNNYKKNKYKTTGHAGIFSRGLFCEK